MKKAKYLILFMLLVGAFCAQAQEKKDFVIINITQYDGLLYLEVQKDDGSAAMKREMKMKNLDRPINALVLSEIRKYNDEGYDIEAVTSNKSTTTRWTKEYLLSRVRE